MWMLNAPLHSIHVLYRHPPFCSYVIWRINKSDIELNPWYKRKQNSKMLSFTLPCYNNLYFRWKYLYQNVVSGNYSNDTSQHFWMDVKTYIAQSPLINMHTCSNRLFFRLAEPKKAQETCEGMDWKAANTVGGEVVGKGKERKVHPVR